MIRAVIFDFDGIIADSEEAHFAGLRETLAREGIYIDHQEYNDRYIALSDKDCFKEAFGASLSSEKLSELIQYKSRILKLSLQKVKLFQGIPEWIKKYSKEISLGICSGALREEITEALTAHDLLERFSVIVSAEDVQQGKPSPEGYLLALQELGKLQGNKPQLLASECLAIEDSIAGVQAAKSAGLLCAAITNSFPKEKLKNANFIFTSISELSLDKL